MIYTAYLTANDCDTSVEMYNNGSELYKFNNI